MTSPDAAKAAAAIELADAIVAEYNNPASKLKGFSTAAIERIVAYEKVLEKLAKPKRQRGASPRAGSEDGEG